MITQLLQSVRSIDKARVAKSGGVAVVLSTGIQVAIAAGVVLPVWAPLAGAVVGIIAYKLLPPKVEAKVDVVVDDAIDIATTLPQTFSSASDYPNAPEQPLSQGQANSNINQG